MTANVMPMTERPNVDAEIGRRIFHLMWDAKITQTQMGQRIGVGQSTLSKKLRGERPWYSGELREAALMLGVTVGFLFGEEDEKAPTPKGEGLSLPGLDSNQEPAGSKPSTMIEADFARKTWGVA